MNDVPNKYRNIHSYCFNNKEKLKRVGQCVCIDCGKKFNYDLLEELDNWAIGDYDMTAICPFCSVDSVVPLVIDGNELTELDLEKMYEYYFK